MYPPCSHPYKENTAHLNAGWSPWNELCQLPLPDPLQALVDLCGVHLPLDDVEQGDVAMIVLPVTRSRHHHVLWLHVK